MDMKSIVQSYILWTNIKEVKHFSLRKVEGATLSLSTILNTSLIS